MTIFRKRNQIWCLWPSKPIGLIEFIGGSYLATNPQISYRRLLEGLNQKGFAIHAWSYIPGFDHQSQANEAWKALRKLRVQFENRIGGLPKAIRLGHSLGCKLHLLAPDGGRNSHSLIALSFNNFTAEKSIPFVEELSSKIGLQAEFSPNPKETMKIISTSYLQSQNLLIRFEKDNIDQSQYLLDILQNREGIDNTKIILMKGDHLTPASYGIRKFLLRNNTETISKTRKLSQLIDQIHQWIKETL
tara:strand:+ start:477 stop:1214 length:738 start_codon:yes stop_codon:yes gene_type:complete